VTTTYLTQFFLLGLLPLLAAGYLIGRSRVKAKRFGGSSFHSPTGYYGWYAVVWMALPALAVSILAAGVGATGMVEVPEPLTMAGCTSAAAVGLLLALRRIKPDLRAIAAVEKLIIWVLVLSSLISILTTLGIVLSIIFEAMKFFKLVSLWDFLTGTSWNPDTAFVTGGATAEDVVGDASFGSIPLFAGTFFITGISMLVAVPVGLFAAIYMSEYASLPMRRMSKPTLEVLAGIPTVVYGFFAAITVSPFIVMVSEWLGMTADYTNALSPGLVMGVMIIPVMSSLSDDVISAVPQSLREGSLAMGATRSETIVRVVLPAALPGIVSAFLLSVSRAVGETMIVVMAAGLRPNLTWNPLEGMTTVTVRIVDALTGDQAFDSPETLSAFGLGLVLLCLTLVLNVVSVYIIRRFRQKYE